MSALVLCTTTHVANHRQPASPRRLSTSRWALLALLLTLPITTKRTGPLFASQLYHTKKTNNVFFLLHPSIYTRVFSLFCRCTRTVALTYSIPLICAGLSSTRLMEPSSTRLIFTRITISPIEASTIILGFKICVRFLFSYCCSGPTETPVHSTSESWGLFTRNSAVHEVLRMSDER